MTQHLSIYLDESGDLGFDFDKDGTSDYFSITLLVCEDRETVDGIKKAVDRTIKNKLNKKKGKQKKLIQELKGSATTLDIKKYFFAQLPSTGWGLYCVTLKKERVWDHLKTRTGKSKLYNYLSRFVLKEIIFSSQLKTINLIVDKCKNSKEIKDFDQYLVNQLQGVLPHPNVRLDISHLSSHRSQGLQAVDLFCWGMARKVCLNDTKWYSLFAGKIKFETVYLSGKIDRRTLQCLTP